jgi:hypothetical protein
VRVRTWRTCLVKEQLRSRSTQQVFGLPNGCQRQQVVLGELDVVIADNGNRFGDPHSTASEFGGDAQSEKVIAADHGGDVWVAAQQQVDTAAGGISMA